MEGLLSTGPTPSSFHTLTYICIVIVVVSFITVTNLNILD